MRVKKILVPDSHAFFGDTFRYIESFLLQIRSNPEIFTFLASAMKQCREPLESCIESLTYSFFLDLIHPENSETDLLNTIKNLIRSELISIRNSQMSGHVSGLLHESVVLKNMLRHYLKKKNQRKYMKLIFKKGLREIIHNQDLIKTIKLDPKLIYIELHKKEIIMQRNSLGSLSTKDKRVSTGRSSKKIEVVEKNPFESIKTEDAMHNEDVYRILVERSSQLAHHCKILLQGIYDNVETMPFGLRWICKQMIISIQEIVPDVSEEEKHTLLGNFLFAHWWIPALFDPIKNGLLQNVIIQPSTLSYLKVIATIFKNIIKSSYFEEFQYFKINEFIADEGAKMKKFLRGIYSFDESIYKRQRIKTFEFEANNIPYEGDRKTMHFYYKSKLSQPVISNSDILTKSKNHLEDEKNMKEFKIISFVVTLNDIRLLAKIVKEKEDVVTERGWNDFLRYAKTIRNSEEFGSLYQASYLRDNNISEQDEIHCFFMKKDFGEYTNDIENSYTANVRKSKIVPGENEKLKLLIKVQDAIRNLLISLDMSLFFDPNKEWSLSDVVEFIIQFSYLFENKKGESQDKIPLKLLAQFLATYLKEIPQEYNSNSFRKLYKHLLGDYEDRYEFMRAVATRNKKLLLLSINFTEKHITDLKHEVKVYETLKQKSFALEFIKTRKVPVCLLTIIERQKPLTQVFTQSTCPHSKLASVNEFVLGTKKTSKGLANIDDTHVTSIEDFYERFMQLEQVQKSTEEEDDLYNVGGAFFEYLQIVKDIIRKDLNNEEDCDMAIEEIEKHITSCMFPQIFPKNASPADLKLYNRTREHEWIKPEHLDIIPANRNEAMWKFAIEALQNIDNYRSPGEKLNCFVNCMSIIVNVLSLMSSSGGGVGTDDSLPLIIYIVLKAQPVRLYSNLNFICKFRHQSKMIGLNGFVFQQFQSAASFIEGLDYRSLTISETEYFDLISKYRDKYQIIS